MLMLEDQRESSQEEALLESPLVSFSCNPRGVIHTLYSLKLGANLHMQYLADVCRESGHRPTSGDEGPEAC
jgi:hypothetical protein